MKKYTTVDEYINAAPDEIRSKLKDIRKLIKDVAPEAEEGIYYGMPGYKVNKKPLVYFAGFKDHISVFPTSSKVEDHIKELAEFRTGKGTLSFPLNQPLPMDLIKELVKLRLKENLDKGKSRKAGSRSAGHTEYHKDGSVWAEGKLKDGKMDGYWKWFRKDGSKMRTGYFKDGKQVREWMTYDKNGKLVKKTLFVDKDKSED